jgi:hypothetical protein
MIEVEVDDQGFSRRRHRFIAHRPRLVFIGEAAAGEQAFKRFAVYHIMEKATVTGLVPIICSADGCGSGLQQSDPVPHSTRSGATAL